MFLEKSIKNVRVIYKTRIQLLFRPPEWSWVLDNYYAQMSLSLSTGTQMKQDYSCNISVKNKTHTVMQ